MTALEPSMMAAMARASIATDDRGRLCVTAIRRVDGRRIRRRKIVPGNDRELAEEVVRQLNRDFALGDFSWPLIQHRREIV